MAYAVSFCYDPFLISLSYRGRDVEISKAKKKYLKSTLQLFLNKIMVQSKKTSSIDLR